jgi:hypothetical protein
VCCGSHHAMALRADATVWVWGRGTQAALGLGGQARNVTRPLPLPSSGDLKSVIAHASASTADIDSTHVDATSFPPPSSGSRIGSSWLHVAAGGANSALLSAAAALPPPLALANSELPPPLPNSPLSFSREAALYMWGANKSGELGHGDVAKRAVPRLVKSFKRENDVRQNLFMLALGASHAVALVEWRCVASPSVKRVGCAGGAVGLTREVGANCREEELGHSLARRNLDRLERDKNGAKKHTTSFEREKREKLFTGGVGGIEGGREKKTKEQVQAKLRKRAVMLDKKKAYAREDT